MEPVVAVLSAEFLGTPAWLWASFLTIVATLLAFDLGVLHRRTRDIGIAESLRLSAAYIAVALAFGGWIWWSMGADDGMAYMTAFFVEKTLALDNVFVISLIFGLFAIPAAYQHRVLFWGILGVIVLRGLLIGVGAALVSEFAWLLYVFGAFLVLTGIKMLVAAGGPPDRAASGALAFLRRHLNVTEGLEGHRFFVRRPDPAGGRARLFVTPLFLALLLIEAADLVFAVDSVPAVFAITTDPFLVYTSNIFAILGLRALYFALAATVDRFRHLKYALALVLIYIGGKVFWAHLVAKPDPVVSLLVTFGLLAGGVLFSLWKTSRAATPRHAQAVEEGGS
jgi:tellurite resistance protein TerC